MRASDLENWVLSIIDRVQRSQPIEDVRAELKSVWPTDIPKASRRIAGHANSSGGEPILWIIGVDEHSNAVVGADTNELANWWPQVQSQFESVVPQMISSLVVPVSSVSVVALLFETDRVPYVVKNPANGQPTGGPVELEVPWREGTRIRSAKRADLIRLLVPLQKLPDIEIRSARLSVSRSKPDDPLKNWNFYMELYAIPLTDHRVVIPYHYCSGTIEMANIRQPIEMKGLNVTNCSVAGFSGFRTQEIRVAPPPPRNEVVIDQPMKICVQGYISYYGHDSLWQEHTMLGHLKLKPVGANRSVVIDVALTVEGSPSETSDDVAWSFASGKVSQMD